MILAVDLAAKFSGACRMTGAGEVLNEWSSWGMTETNWVNSLAANLAHAEIMLIEDLPFGLKLSKTVRDVYRLQGRIIENVHNRMLYAWGNNFRKIVFVQPQVWQLHFKPDGMKAGDKVAARRIALEKYGYSPPELLHKDLHGKDRQSARKAMEDHVDAFMIARYMLEQVQLFGSVDKAVDALPRLERFVASED